MTEVCTLSYVCPVAMCDCWQLCVSMILNKDRKAIQEGDPPSPFSSLGDDGGPDASKYDDDDATKTTAPPNPQNWTWGPNGFPKQLDYDKAYEALMDEFVSDHWDCMKVKREKESEGKRKYVHNGIESKNNEATDVEVICGEGFDGLWYKGPKKVSIYRFYIAAIARPSEVLEAERERERER